MRPSVALKPQNSDWVQCWAARINAAGPIARLGIRQQQNGRISA
jgi:hypothetical protein